MIILREIAPPMTALVVDPNGVSNPELASFQRYLGVLATGLLPRDGQGPEETKQQVFEQLQDTRETIGVVRGKELLLPGTLVRAMKYHIFSVKIAGIKDSDSRPVHDIYTDFELLDRFTFFGNVQVRSYRDEVVTEPFEIPRVNY